MMILIAGPYASGTDGDPALMAQNLKRLETAAWPLFRAGHVPMIGEWVALPVLDSAGATGPADPLAAEVMYPTAERLLQRCDAVLRLPGASRGADQDVAIAEARGLPVYYALEDVPGVTASTRPEGAAPLSCRHRATVVTPPRRGSDDRAPVHGMPDGQRADQNGGAVSVGTGGGAGLMTNATGGTGASSR